MKEVRILFKWETVKADVGEFRQDSDLLTVVKVVDPQGDVFVGVRLPLSPEYWDNYEEIAIAQMGNGDIPTPILTPAGMAYAKRKLEEPFRPPLVNLSEQDKASLEEEWMTTEKKLNPGKVAPPDNEEWVTTTTPPITSASKADKPEPTDDEWLQSNSPAVTGENKEDWGDAPPWDTPTEENWDDTKENWEGEK